jgi:glyoxylase-like metal-dependent hydrolase (beta-lactamase superfamily II)
MNTNRMAVLVMALVPTVVTAQTGFNSRIDSTAKLSPAARSALEARSILTKAIDAAGGLQALRAIASISTDRSMLRTSTGQGMHPGAPAVEHAILLTRLDLRSRRAFTLRDLEIDGGQIWGTATIVTADSGFDINYANRTYFSRTPAQYGNVRVGLLRGELPTLLLSAWNRPEQTRSTGRAVIRGRQCEGIVFADADGSLVTLYFDATTHLLARSEFVADDPTRGDAAFSTDHSDYRPVGALRVPFRTQQDGPGPERWETTLTRVVLDAPLADSLFALPRELDVSAPSEPIKKLAEGVYALSAGVAVEFNDFVVMFEAYGDSRRSAGNIARLRSVIPSKPIRYVISSHYHEDHLGGVREYAALGASFITTRDAVARLRENLLARHVLRADSFSAAPRNPAIEIVDSVRVIADATRRLELYQIGPTAHVDKILIAYLPKERILIEGDLLDNPGGKPAAGGEDTKQFADKIREMKLDVERIVPIHGSPATATMQDLERAVTMQRARARCSPELVARLFCGFWKPEMQTGR